MGIGKQGASCGQRVDIGGVCLRVPIETTDPIVQIVNRNQEDVWAWRLSVKRTDQTEYGRKDSTKLSTN